MTAGRKILARTVTLRLAGVLAAILALNALLWLVTPAALRETTIDHTLLTVQGASSDDSWGVMAVALDHLRQRPDLPLYRTLFFEEHNRFQYPPSSLFALMAMEALGPSRVRTTENYSGPWPTVNDVLGWAALLATAIAAFGLLEHGLRGAIDGDDTFWRASRGALVACLVLTFYPLVKAFSLGQIQTWLNAALTLALLAWARGKRGIAGALVAVAILVKPHYGLLLVWGVFDRAYRFVFTALAVLSAGLLASIAVFGFPVHLDYVSVLSFLSRHGETFYPNQSVNGLLNRLAGVADPVHYTILELPQGVFPPFNLWIYGATLVTSLALLGLGLTRRTGKHETDPQALATMLLAVTIASPIAWEHHYGIAFGLFAILHARATRQGRSEAWLFVAYVLVSTPVMVANALAGTYANVLQSTLLLGAFVLLSEALDWTGRHLDGDRSFGTYAVDTSARRSG